MCSVHMTLSTCTYPLSLHDALPIYVFLTGISPPDADGWCSFGMSVWGAPEVAREATHVIGEVNERFIRTGGDNRDRKSTRLNSSHRCISYAVFCLKKQNDRVSTLKK